MDGFKSEILSAFLCASRFLFSNGDLMRIKLNAVSTFSEDHSYGTTPAPKQLGQTILWPARSLILFTCNHAHSPAPSWLKAPQGNERHLLTLEPITTLGTVLNQHRLVDWKTILKSGSWWCQRWARNVMSRVFELALAPKGNLLAHDRKTQGKLSGTGLMGQRWLATHVPLGFL